MKILLDENLPHALRPLLMPPHDVFTVAYLGWDGVSNGELLKRAASNGFDAILTTDRGYEHQHNLSNLPCAIILLFSATNQIHDLAPLVPVILDALKVLAPKSIVKIG